MRGAVALAAVAAIYGALLARLRRFETARAAALPWWFGYARDGTNVFCAALYAGGFFAAGLPGPSALTAGVALLCAHYVADWAFGKKLALRLGPPIVAFAVAATGAALALCARPLAAALARLLDAAAPG